MRVVSINKTTITKTQLENKLKIKIKSIRDINDNNYIRILTDDKIIYLRCEDIKDLFKLNFNVFDKDVRIINNDIVFKSKKEEFRGSVKKWMKKK